MQVRIATSNWATLHGAEVVKVNEMWQFTSNLMEQSPWEANSCPTSRKKLPTFYGAWVPLPCTQEATAGSPPQSNESNAHCHPISLRSISLWSSHVCLGLMSVSSFQVLWQKYNFTSCFVCVCMRADGRAGREEHKLNVFENRVLRRVSGPKIEKTRSAGCWRKLRNEELYQVLLGWSSRMSWAGHIACTRMWEMRYARM
jgi:hypothetical protein